MRRILAIIGLVWFVKHLYSCPHDVRSLPQAGKQFCMQCAAWRTYPLGERPGRWRKPHGMKAGDPLIGFPSGR